MEEARLSAEVQALARLGLPALRVFWRRRWGEPPKLRSPSLLAYAAAYRLQAEAEGDLSSATSRRLADFARRFTADRDFRPEGVMRLAPGCSLVREWGGARHEVKVMEDGFAYAGQRFASLSAAAAHITGAKRSGVLFFGLKTGKGA